MTGWQKARVLLGTLNLDDFIDSALNSFPDILSTSFNLVFESDSSNNYEVRANLLVQPVTVDRCQSEVNAVRAAQSVVDAVDQEIRQLQTDLQHASPTEKPFIISEIRRLREEDLTDAMAALANARAALSTCRSRTSSVFPNT